MADASKPFPIVGIGASAGGIQALEGFFKGLDQEGGLAFVIVTHLSPERVSLLHEIIARYTQMPVRVAEDGARVECDTVYVLPENALITIEDRRLQIRRPNALHRERKPIDIFFGTLARDHNEYSVGIVLSGGDGDGSLGIKAIKECGGLTLAQVADGFGPSHPDMPDTAIASGLVDFALPVEAMGTRLRAFVRSFDLVEGLDHPDADEAIQAAREAIYKILRNQSGHDFSGYKSNTFMRRVQRRMQVVELGTLDAYTERLRQDPAEVTSLFRDLLISVTNFFRDAEAFDALRDMVIPRLFEDRGAGDTVRVWVPGCATGEEVFSIAILMREHLDTSPVAPRVQIFSTDIDERALVVARTARYPEALLDGVSQQRRDRFFTHDGGSYVVNKEVREMCIFSPHSVVRDPPFSRMDLVSCRNLLIYFGPQIQSGVIPTFHYSLKPGGFLFLGTSENISQHADLFATIDKKQRIFQRRDHASSAGRLPMVISGLASSRFGGSDPDRRAGRGVPALRQAIETQVLERFAPAHVVVNGEGEVVYFSAKTGRYLEPPQGIPSRQILTMARRGLRLDLRGILREVIERRQPVSRENLAIEEEEDDRIQMISLSAEPLSGIGGGEPLYLILFTPLGPPISRIDADTRGQANSDATLAGLERELRDTRERLQATIEEYETALEELKSSNEELVSVNEESQSTNEELEASKEEMQSLNEELNTINSELLEKVGELDHANSDLKNLFESTQIATIFLDRGLVIRSFTPAASIFFNLIPTDAGRPLTDLAGRLAYPELKADIRKVFETGEVVEHRTDQDDGRTHYLVRLLPYLDADEKIRGVVATFIDVTTLTEAEAHQKVLIAELNHRVKNMLAVVVSIAQRTMMSASSPEAFHEALVGRLHAMARAYELLARENWKEASASELMRQELSPFGFDHITMKGPEIRLDPRSGLSLGMVVHELATNAAKYGALSVPDGRIAIEWTMTDGRFRLRWREKDGPEIAEPTRRGFGLTLVEREIGYSLSGETDIAFKPDGLVVELSFAFKSVSTPT